jgi:hypothetical protein
MIEQRLFSSLAALAALGCGQSGMAQSVPCLSEQEVVSLVGFSLPTVVDSTIKTCQPRLSSQGYFGTQGAALVARFAANKPATWPSAKAAFIKLGASKDPATRDMIAKLPDSALQPFAEGIVAQLVASKIKPDRCAVIERGVSLVAPLPPQNTAELIAFVIVLADKAGADKASKFPICPARS